MMPAPKGNQFWLARSKSGRNPIFKSPALLFKRCLEYFQWAEDNPLMAAETVKFQGEAKLTEVPKMRAMTIDGLCIFLDIARQTWNNYKEKDDFLAVTMRAEGIMRNQKFTGAAADLLNPTIIARDLGLVEKKELGSDPNKPIRVIGVEMTAAEATKLYKDIIDD